MNISTLIKRWLDNKKLKEDLLNEVNSRRAAEKMLLVRTAEFTRTRKLYNDLIFEVEKKVEDQSHELIQYERRFKDIVESVSDIIYKSNPRGEFTLVNAVAEEKTGFKPEELIGTKYLDLVEPNFKNQVEAFYIAHLLENISASSYYEFPIRHKNGNMIWIGQTVKPVYNLEGILVEFIGVARDISIQKHTEQELGMTNSRMKSLIENFHGAVLLEDENRRIVLVNQRFCDLFQIPFKPEDLVGFDCTESAQQSKAFFTEPESFVTRIDKILKEKNKVIEEQVLFADGRILERDYIPIYLNEYYRGHLWQYRDVTQKNQYQNMIRESEEKYRGIIENMQLGLLEVDRNDIIVKAYDWFCDMIGYQEHEILGKNAIDLFLPTEYHNFFKKQTEPRLQGQSGVYEIEMIKKNGEKIWVMISGAPVFDNSRNIVGSLGIHYDITKQKKLQEELIMAKQEAERAREAEKQFLASISHEIRNPINAVVGMSNLLYDTKLDDVQLEYLDTIKFSSEVLLSLISDVLDINKIESGEMNYEESEVDLQQSVNSIVQMFTFKSKNLKVKIRSRFIGNFDYYVLTDRTFINQILMNLISNAVKFTEKGYIEMVLELGSETPEEYSVIIVVTDTGIGIPADKLETVFESFKQVSNQIKLKYGGTGLGLAITKRLVDFLNGEIKVVSELGMGSSFILKLKLKKSPKKIQQQIETVSMPVTDQLNLKVLAVEDNLMNQRYLKSVLRKLGMDYQLASNGQEALRILELEAFDLVLMDIRMPIMDGYEASIRIRTLNNSNAHVPIIALTASALLDERDKALKAGMNHHLTKPFVEDQLLKTIKEVMNLNKIEPPKLKQGQNGVFDFPKEFDLEILKTYYGIDANHMAITFGDFCKFVFIDLDLLTQYLDNQNWSLFADLLHKIKPNFTMIGLPDLTIECEELENIVKNNKNLTGAEFIEKHSTFKNKIDYLKPIIEQEKDRLLAMKIKEE